MTGTSEIETEPVLVWLYNLILQSISFQLRSATINSAGGLGCTKALTMGEKFWVLIIQKRTRFVLTQACKVNQEL